MSDNLEQFGKEYAALRQAYIDNTPVSTEPLTEAQREVVRHDTGQQRLWPFAPTNKRPGTTLAPMEDDPRYADYLRMVSEERQTLPGYGILRRRLEARHE